MPFVTTTRLNQTITNATVALGDLMGVYVMNKRKGNPCGCTLVQAEYLFMALTVLNNWQQNASGSDTGKINYITQAQLSNLVSTVETIVKDAPLPVTTRVGAFDIDFLSDEYD